MLMKDDKASVVAKEGTDAGLFFSIQGKNN